MRISRSKFTPSSSKLSSWRRTFPIADLWGLLMITWCTGLMTGLDRCWDSWRIWLWRGARRREEDGITNGRGREVWSWVTPSRLKPCFSGSRSRWPALAVRELAAGRTGDNDSASLSAWVNWLKRAKDAAVLLRGPDHGMWKYTKKYIRSQIYLETEESFVIRSGKATTTSTPTCEVQDPKKCSVQDTQSNTDQIEQIWYDWILSAARQEKNRPKQKKRRNWWVTMHQTIEMTSKWGVKKQMQLIVQRFQQNLRNVVLYVRVTVAMTWTTECLIPKVRTEYTNKRPNLRSGRAILSQVTFSESEGRRSTETPDVIRI